MRLCVNVNGKDVDDELIFFKGPVTLWFRLEPGYDVEPPDGQFSVGETAVAGPFPHHEIKKPGEYKIQFADATQRFVISRSLTFVRRERLLFLGLTATLAALLWVLTIWKLGIVLENGNREVKSLWSLDTLLPGTTLVSGALFASFGLSQQRLRNYLYAQHHTGVLLTLLAGALALVIQVTCFRALTNAAPEKISPFGIASSLEPEATTLSSPLLLKAQIGKPFEPCDSGANCETLDASFSSLLLRFPSNGTTVVRCAREGFATLFLEDLKGDKSCTPDPTRVITRAPSKMPVTAPPAALTADDSGVRYELRPFAAGLEQAFDTLATSLVHVQIRSGQTTAISELVLDGHDLLQRVHVPWRASASGATVAYAPWLAAPAALVSGRVLSGASVIGTLACAFPGNGAQQSIEFTPSRAHLKRISVERLDTGTFHQSYDIERPELVTHVPWCGTWRGEDGKGADPAEYAVHLYFEDSWTPENWSIALPARVTSVHVHGRTLADNGKLSLRKGAQAPGRVELVAYEIPADVRAMEGEQYVWEGYESANRQRATVWALKDDAFFNVELWNGDKRRTLKSTGFKLETLPLRRCIIDRRTNGELSQASASCKRDGLAKWLADFPHPDCSPATSLLCTQ